MGPRFFFFASLLGVSACAAPSPAVTPAPKPRSEPIFRTINIAPFGEITLARPFAQRATLGVPVRDRTYLLGGGRFADTDSILVTVDASGRVESIEFVYVAGKDFVSAVAEYEATLGPPQSRDTRMARSAQIDRVTWNDGLTIFELRRYSALEGKTTVRSTMRNAEAPISRPQN
jgi:hypothetical protein